jgi:hypothetical protein
VEGKLISKQHVRRYRRSRTGVFSSYRQSWARAFFWASHLRFRIPRKSFSRSWEKFFAFALSRSFFGLKFCTFVFALSRSWIFRAHTFALLNFRARNFVLVRLYTARTGQPGKDTLNRPEQDRQSRTARTGQPEQDNQNRTARTGQVEQDCLDRTART